MIRSLINVRSIIAVNASITGLLLTILLFMPAAALAELKIDGRLDDPEWANARVFKDFVVIEPLTFNTPRLQTQALLLSTPKGLAVAFICEQPEESRTRTITQRDSQQFDADSVSLMVDFDGTGEIAHEFSVSITGSYRDGTITNETTFSRDWDSVWEKAVNEEKERWTAEILLPWSIVAMREGSGETRQIAVFFQREVHSTGETFAYPATSSGLTRFVSDFARIEVPRYSAQEFDVWPYVTVLSDLLHNSIKGKGGMDLFWKPSGRFQVVATFNPDFGQVESDDLVIDFSAIETRFSDKRPFFTENQGIFGESLPVGDRIFYTRRIGGTRDDNRGPGEIDGALKVIGSAGSLNYGLFAAYEADKVGRSFYAGRVIFPGENWSVGALSTYVERPYLDRTALVNTIDYDVKAGDSLRWYGEVISGKIDSKTGDRNGWGAFNVLEYTPNDRWSYDTSLLQYTDTIDITDMGYCRRNNIEELHFGVEYRHTDFPDDSPIASVTWTSTPVARKTMKEGLRLPAVFTLGRNQKMRSGSNISFNLRVETRGYDDLTSRGNGLVYLSGHWSGSLSYSTPRRGAWRKSASITLFQEGYEDWGAGFETDVTWYPYENLNLDFRLVPRWSKDWLIWLRGTQFASYSRANITGKITVNWFPAERHEVRLNAQWLTINAKAEQGYRIGPSSRLVPVNDSIEDFAMLNFGLQVRYRYEIAPLSDLYLVYSRGGLDRIDNPDQSTLNMLGSSTSIRDSDQFLIKLRYRF